MDVKVLSPAGRDRVSCTGTMEEEESGDDLPGMKMVRAEFGFYFRDGYGDQGDDA